MTTRAEVFYTHLSSAVGTYVGGRVTRFPLPPNQQLPAVIYRRVYGGHTERTSGQPSYFHTRWQVDIITDTFTEGEELSEVVISYFDSRGDTTSDPVIYDTKIDMAFPVRDMELDAYRNIVDVSVLSD